MNTINAATITRLADEFLQNTLQMRGTDEAEALSRLESLNRLQAADSTTRDFFSREVHRLAMERHLTVDGRLPETNRIVDAIIEDEMSWTDRDLALSLFHPDSHAVETTRAEVVISGMLSSVESLFEAADRHPLAAVAVLAVGAAVCRVVPIAPKVLMVVGSAYLIYRVATQIVEASNANTEVESLLASRRTGVSLGEIASQILPAGLMGKGARALSFLRGLGLSAEASAASTTAARSFSSFNISYVMNCFGNALRAGNWGAVMTAFENIYLQMMRVGQYALADEFLASYVTTLFKERIFFEPADEQAILRICQHLRVLVNQSVLEASPNAPQRKVLRILDVFSVQIFSFILRHKNPATLGSLPSLLEELIDFRRIYNRYSAVFENNDPEANHRILFQMESLLRVVKNQITRGRPAAFYREPDIIQGTINLIIEKAGQAF